MKKNYYLATVKKIAHKEVDILVKASCWKEAKRIVEREYPEKDGYRANINVTLE